MSFYKEEEFAFPFDAQAAYTNSFTGKPKMWVDDAYPLLLLILNVIVHWYASGYYCCFVSQPDDKDTRIKNVLGDD